MDSKGDSVVQWMNALKTAAGQKHFLENDVQHAIELAVNIRTHQLSESSVQLVRLLRNSVALGEAAINAILRGGLVAALVRALHGPATPPISTSVSAPPPQPGTDDAALCSAAGAAPSSGVDTSFRAACAQLLANVASSGPEGAAEVWAHCFPEVFLGFLTHPSGQVHKPATLALYSCCRQSLSCSRALCAATTAAAEAAEAPFGAADPGVPGDSDGRGSGGNALTDPASTGSTSGAAAAAKAAAAVASFTGGNVPGAGPNTMGPARSGNAEARAIWEALLGRLRADKEPRLTEDARGGGIGGPDWTSLLCGCVALRQGLLGPLLRMLAPPTERVPVQQGRALGTSGSNVACGGDAGSAVVTGTGADVGDGAKPPALGATTGASADPTSATAVHAAWRAGTTAATGFGPLWTVLLHVLAHELLELRGGGAVDLEGWTQTDGWRGGREGTAADGKAVALGPPLAGAVRAVAAAAAAPLAALPPSGRPVGAALLVVTEVVEAAARCLAAVVWGDGGGGGRATRPERDGGVAGAATPASAPSIVAIDKALAAEVLEAGLEVLKSVTQREDGGRPIAGGTDLADWLLRGSGHDGSGASGSGSSGVLPRILGMLAALQPTTILRDSRRHRGAAVATGSAVVGAAAASPLPSAAPPPADRPVAVLPLALQALAVGFPADPPYMGYRGDLASVLSNGAFRRPQVVSELLGAGGLELLLAQTHLDEHSPLAREWALWGVRNMCESSQEVQSHIAGLQLQTVVETPELKQLGMRLELDKATGKLMVSKTQEAEALLDSGRPVGR